MKSVMIKDRQNIIDLAIQYYGSAAAVIDLCLDNDLELDDEVYPGQLLLLQDNYPESAQPDYADYLTSKDITIVGSTYPYPAEVLGTNSDEFLATNNNEYFNTQ